MLSDKFFISKDIVERKITMADGTEEVLFFKQLPNSAFERYALWCNSSNEDVVATAGARLLVLGLCEPDGKAAVDLATAERIKRPVMLSLLSALLDVNGYGKKASDAGNA